jgi:serine/threonine-protein kinase
MGDFPHALEQFERVLALLRAELGDDHPEVGTALHNLGMVSANAQRFADARRYLESALANRKRTLGTEDHPHVGLTLRGLATVYSNESRYAEARPYYEQALRIFDRVFGPGSPDAGELQLNFGVDFFEQCQFAEAARRYRDALTGLDHQGRQNVVSLFALDNLGDAQLELGAYAQAEQSYREALARPTAGAGTEGMHPTLVNALIGLANVALARGRPAQALPRAREAVAFAERRVPPHEIDRAQALTALGRALLALGRPSEALPLLERALTVHEQSKLPVSPSRPETQLALADALWRTGADRARALELARLAQRTVTVECPQPRLAGEIERWRQRTATR